jgi:hypothetical protein
VRTGEVPLGHAVQKRVAKFQWESKPDDELHMSDFKAYLAGSSEDEDEDAGDERETKRAAERLRLRQALLGEASDDAGKKTKRKSGEKQKKERTAEAMEEVVGDEGDRAAGDEVDAVEEDDLEEGNKTSVVRIGLGEDILKRKAQRELEAKETPFEKQRRLAKEKQKKRRAAKMADHVSEDDLQKEPGKPSKAARKEKLRAKKAKLEKVLEEGVDLTDVRFAAVVSDPKFAVDLQDKAFKNTKVRVARGGAVLFVSV